MAACIEGVRGEQDHTGGECDATHGARAAYPLEREVRCAVRVQVRGVGIVKGKLNKMSRGARITAMLAVACGLSFATALQAQTIEQGLLQLEWGDPPPAAAGQQRLAPRFNASLLKDDGSRIALDPAQARLAAGDLYVLANRRVAVAFAPQGRVMSSAPAIQAIVPADRVTQSAPVHAANARVMAAAPINGVTRWVTLMCKFSDIGTEQKTKAFFDSQYGDAVGQLGRAFARDLRAVGLRHDHDGRAVAEVEQLVREARGVGQLEERPAPATRDAGAVPAGRPSG